MARKTVRITIPSSKPDDFSKLLNNIVTQDTQLGDKSPLKGDSDIDMPDFVTKLAQADNFHQQSENLKAQSEDLMQRAKTIYGTGVGQNINTPGTLYYILDIIKQTLLKKNKGNEDALSRFGFSVVIGQSKSPVPKNKKP